MLIIILVLGFAIWNGVSTWQHSSGRCHNSCHHNTNGYTCECGQKDLYDLDNPYTGDMV